MATMAADFRAVFKEGESGMKATFSSDDALTASFGDVQLVSTSDYEKLYNKPKINGVTLMGDRSFEDLGENSMTNMEIVSIFNRVFGG